MAKQLTADQHAAFQQLCRDNNLDPRADVWQHPQSGLWIIARTGIEKIQGKNNIAVSFEMVRCDPDFACVKATATRTVKLEGKTTSSKLVVESFGSALPGNCKVNYFAEMAEKRALSRVVLKQMGFYALGIYGEDEAEDFKRPAEAAPVANPAPESPKKPEAAAVTPAPTSPAPSPTSAPNEDELAAVRQVLAGIRSKMDLKELWESVSESAQPALKDDFTAARVRIEAVIAEATKTPQPTKTPALPVPAQRPAQDAEGQPIEYATVAQRTEIQRLLNHPLVTRPQKANVLLRINKYTQAEAEALLAQLNQTIDGDEHNADHQAFAGRFKAWIREESAARRLPLKEAERLLNVADKQSSADIRTEWMAAREAQGINQEIAA